MRTLRGAWAERRVEVTIDARDHRQRSRDLEAEVQALRAEVRRLRAELERSQWLDRVTEPVRSQAIFGRR